MSFSPRSSPPAETGCAAPMLVPGAMAATWAACTMKAPAEAARPPPGTHTTTGTGEARMDCTMPRMDSTSPPGVSS